MRIALFPAKRLINMGQGGHVKGELRFSLERLPRLVIDAGMLPWDRAYGLRIAWGLRHSIRSGETWHDHEMTLFRVSLETLIGFPWLWWSPVRPIYRTVAHEAVAWTGRDREVIGVEIDWPWRRYGRRITLWN